MIIRFRHLVSESLVLGLALAIAPPTSAQQVADSSFDVRVARPAFTKNHPRLMFDEAHHNFDTSTGRYFVFANLARNDGIHVIPNAKPFSPSSLRRYNMLVIANALGHEDMGDSAASNPAFTAEECDAVRDWVLAGGALLLIADHSPMGSAARPLASRFGVDMRSGYLIDPLRSDTTSGPSNLFFSGAAGTLPAHPITQGRYATERVSRVESFTGQSLSGWAGSFALLPLSDEAEDLMVGLGQASTDVPKEQRLPAKGRSQALAFTFGKGRVVVFGSAAMLTAQLAGPRRFKIGMNADGIDNRQLVLNVLAWLGRVIPIASHELEAAPRSE